MSDLESVLEDAQNNRQHVGNITNSYDLQHVKFSVVEGYGQAHALATQRLAEHIARVHYKMEPQDTLVVGFAALLHDLARSQPFHGEDPGHRTEGLDLAHKVLTTDPQFSRYIQLHERVLRLLNNHNLDSPVLPTDPLAICLWDADSYESFRHAPNTEAGAILSGRRMARVVSPWAKSRVRQLHYARYHKWNIPKRE